MQQRTQLTCSVGIAANMTVAKICSDYRKPNGQFEVARTRAAIVAFMHSAADAQDTWHWQGACAHNVFGSGRVVTALLPARAGRNRTSRAR